jgi:chromosomal replication initiator protein
MKNNILYQKTENFSEKKLDWIIIQSVMKSKFGKGIYESWIKKIEFINEFNDYILISVSTRFIRDWITSRYLDQILQIVKSYKKNVNRIEFIIKELEDNKIVQRQNEQEQSPETNASVSFIKDSYLQYNRIDPNKKFDNFILGFSNKLAYEASKKSISRYFSL